MKWKLAGAILALTVIGSCSPDQPEHPAGAVPYTEEELRAINEAAAETEGAGAAERADEVMACGLALVEAEKRGLVAEDAVMPTPWQIAASPTDSGKRLSCKGRDAAGPLTVVADFLCSDVNDPTCHPLVRINRP